jgi:AcrR family transcriptional regulator
MYVKLRPGPNGPGPELVARHQRARLYHAIVELVLARGYAVTSIKAVCALAGVSRRTFYDLFGDAHAPPKQACFLAAYEYVVGGAARRVRLSYRTEPDPHRRLQRAFEQFAHELVARPQFARFALIEPLGGAPSARLRIDCSRHLFEKMIGASFQDGPDGVTLPALVVKAIVCGVERIARQRLLADRVQELPGLAEELLSWALSYRSPAVRELKAVRPRGGTAPVPFRPHAHADSDRARMLRCAARIAAAGGYAQLSPGRIASAAGVHEGRFNELFASTEQCLLEALDRMALEALVAVAGARPGDATGVGLHGRVVALMRHLAADPCLVQVAFQEIFALGYPGVARRDRSLGRFTTFLTLSKPAAPPAGLVAEATVGAIWGIVDHYATRGAARRLPMVAGHATYMALAPVLGAHAAVEIIRGADGDG